jgi:hypothetical protein
MKLEGLNVSEKNKTFFWLPPKCASTSLSWVLSYFEFSSIAIDVDTNEIQRISLNQTHYGHSMIYPSNYSELTFVCAVRNPYHRTLSMYKSHSKDLSVNNFENFINEKLLKNENLNTLKITGLFTKKIPDYYIRTENIYEDLIKIPFIGESELNTSGVLKTFCLKKMNMSFNQPNPEEYLTPRIKETIYEIFSEQFELFGYEK